MKCEFTGSSIERLFYRDVAFKEDQKPNTKQTNKTKNENKQTNEKQEAKNKNKNKNLQVRGEKIRTILHF